GGGGYVPPVTPPVLPPGLGCTEQWLCDEWGECVLGVRTRECVDLYSCGTTYTKPRGAEVCVKAVPTSNATIETPLAIINLPQLEDLYRLFLRNMVDLLLIGLLVALFLALYLQREETAQEHEARVFTESTEEILVPTEFLTLADMVLYEVFKGAPDPHVWEWLNKRFPPLVVRTCRLALLDASTDLKKGTVTHDLVLRIHQQFNYINYKLFVQTVRAMAQSRILDIPVRLIIQRDVNQAVNTQAVVEDVRVRAKQPGGDKLPIQTVTLRNIDDVKDALAMLRSGPGAIIINIKPLAKQDLKLVKKAVQLLKRTAEITGGGALGMGVDYIIVTNEIPIEKFKGGIKHGTT
ncbi:MAG TPA: hypothetical protein VLJ21_01315, partial [Candidatus Binatia bacterium]|nr:hypothetical protein [Candidatus Binatia bacterium]